MKRLNSATTRKKPRGGKTVFMFISLCRCKGGLAKPYTAEFTRLVGAMSIRQAKASRHGALIVPSRKYVAA
jgi:hypothetical protein